MFDGEAIAKTFTRYVVPGLIFVFLAVIAPASLVDPRLFFGKEPWVGATQIVILSVLTGYVLDAVRGYRWTLSWRAYRAEHAVISGNLGRLQDRPQANPDELLAGLFVRNEVLYNRIFVERAEWVMILETALSLWLSALALLLVGAYLHFRIGASGWLAWATSPLLLGISLLASRNGIDRMRAHNAKIVEAIRSLDDLQSPAWPAIDRSA